MRILHLVSYSLYSGPLPSTLGVAIAQRQLGHDVALAYDRKRGAINAYEEAAGPHVDAQALAPSELLTLSTKSSPFELWRDCRALHRLATTADVVHAHMSHDHLVAALAGAKNIVRTVHAARSLTPRLGQRWLLRQARGIIVRCGEQDAACARLGFDRRAFIAGGVDAQRFRPATAEERQRARQRFGIPEDARVVLQAALIQDRGQEELAGALVRVNAPDLHVLYVGRGQHEDALRLLTEGIGLAGKTHFPGYLDQEHLLDAYHAADVAFVAQPGNDGSARAALEAMACALPVIAVQTGALAELVTDACGYAVEERRPEAIARGLQTWLCDALAGERGVNARQKMLAERTFEQEARTTVEFYERCLARHA